MMSHTQMKRFYLDVTRALAGDVAPIIAEREALRVERDALLVERDVLRTRTAQLEKDLAAERTR